MRSGGERRDYYRISVPGKGTYGKDGVPSNDPAATHIDLSQNSIDEIRAIVRKIQGA